MRRQETGKGDSEVSTRRRTRKDEDRGWIIALEDDHRNIDVLLTYRSNSYARSRARVPGPKPCSKHCQLRSAE